MNSYKLVLSYKGTLYQGWQIQPEGKTIQGELNSALKKIVKNENVKSIGSGRTDAGVHALAQVARVDIPLEISPEKLKNALNAHLPLDIRVKEASISNLDFQPVFSAQSKWYSYFFTNTEEVDPLIRDLVVNYSYPLEIQKINKACKIFIGKHDFVNFHTQGTPVRSTIREIISCEFLQHPPGSLPFTCSENVFEFRFHGTGFLKQMVRMIVGALWAVGRGKITIKNISETLVSYPMPRLAAVAPPEGLYLMRVVYGQN